MVSFYNKKGRINILVYDSSPVILSLDLKTGVNYYLYLPVDFKISVPGGYGEYRIGSIGKLADLEKDPELVRRSFSFLLGSFIDFYFYPNLSKVWYSKEKRPFLRKWEILRYRTNANLLARSYVLFKFFSLNSASFSPLKIKSFEVERGRINFSKFHSRIQGDFYLPEIRRENKKIRIFYAQNYKAAENLGRIFKGEGIDVLSYETFPGRKVCKVVGREKNFSLEYLQKIFGCQVQIDKNLEPNLIKFYLGKIEEEKWK